MSNYSDSDFNNTDENTSWHKTFNLIPAESKVLDVGCSSGTFGEHLIKQKNCIVDGIEIDDGDIAAAKKRLRNVYKINIETDPIDIKDRYDIIFMGDVVEHLARPIESLKKIRDLLSPNGTLVFSMPNITHMSVRLMLLSGEIQYGKTGLLDETHLHFYNSKEIYRVFNAAGFRIDIFDYTVNDIPNKVLDKELQKIGLKPTKKFFELAKSLDGAAYQFLGKASKSKAVIQELPKTSPLNVIDSYIAEWQRQNDANLAAVIADRDSIADENKDLKSRIRFRKIGGK